MAFPEGRSSFFRTFCYDERRRRETRKTVSDQKGWKAAAATGFPSGICMYIWNEWMGEGLGSEIYKLSTTLASFLKCQQSVLSILGFVIGSSFPIPLSFIPSFVVWSGAWNENKANPKTTDGQTRRFVGLVSLTS
jgi:hypothetical protein